MAASTEASLTGVTLMSRVTELESASPSLTMKVTVRVRAEGSSEVFSYVTVRSAAW